MTTYQAERLQVFSSIRSPGNSVLSQQIIDNSIKTPLYMQVYSALYQWIRQGRYKPGDKLESEAALCESFGVSRISVRKALDLLAAEGWVFSKQGKGTFVSDKRPVVGLPASMEEQILRSAEFARASRTRDLNIERISAPSDIAAELKLEQGEPVFSVSYVRMAKGKPLGLVRSYFPCIQGLSFSATDFIQNTSVTVLAQKGIPMSGIENMFGATLADTELARLLDSHVGAPLLSIKMTVLDDRAAPLAWLQSFWRADRYEHHVFMARNTETGAPRDQSPVQST